MKIKCTVTIDIDPEAYALAYGIPKSDIGKDVQVSAVSILEESFRASGVLAQSEEFLPITDFSPQLPL